MALKRNFPNCDYTEEIKLKDFTGHKTGNITLNGGNSSIILI